MSLLQQSRYEEAASLLASVAGPAGGIYGGADDPEVKSEDLPPRSAVCHYFTG